MICTGTRGYVKGHGRAAPISGSTSASDSLKSHLCPLKSSTAILKRSVEKFVNKAYSGQSGWQHWSSHGRLVGRLQNPLRNSVCLNEGLAGSSEDFARTRFVNNLKMIWTMEAGQLMSRWRGAEQRGKNPKQGIGTGPIFFDSRYFPPAISERTSAKFVRRPDTKSGVAGRSGRAFIRRFLCLRTAVERHTGDNGAN